MDLLVSRFPERKPSLLTQLDDAGLPRYAYPIEVVACTIVVGKMTLLMQAPLVTKSPQK